MNEKLKGPKLFLVPALFLMFFVYAVYFNSFGPNAGFMRDFFNISESQFGMIITVQSVGSVIFGVYLSLYGEKYNKLKGVILGLFLISTAAVLIGTMTLYCKANWGYALLLVFSGVGGVGIIIIDLLMNGVVADIYPDRKNDLLPHVHAFYGVGAMLAPIFVTASTKTDVSESFSKPFLIIGIVGMAIIVMGLALHKKVVGETPYADMESIRKRVEGDPAEVYRSPKAWLFILAAAFYAAFQNGMSAWMPSYCRESMGFDLKWAGIMLTAYFAGILAVRLMSPAIYKKISVEKFFVLSNILSVVVFATLFIRQPDRNAMLLSMVVGGLLNGASIPALIIMCCDEFPHRSASASALIVIGVSIASLGAPALMGYLIEVFGYLTAMLSSTACILVSVVIVMIMSKGKVKTA